MRYLPHTSAVRKEMMNDIGIKEINELFCDVPESARLKAPLNLSNHQDEQAVESWFLSQSAHNKKAVASFLGAGLYHHHIPAAVDHLIQRGEFLTSYTPYQPEISQGTLQYLFEFQTQVAMLFGMEVANASLYDGATATVEAVMMANRLTKRNRVVLSGGLHPHYREVVETYGNMTGFDVTSCQPILKGSEDFSVRLSSDVSAIVVQYPNFFGSPQDLTQLAQACHAAGALLIVVVTEVVALGLLPSPGSMGADIVVGEGQSIGNGVNFGGPTVGLFATRHSFVRQMPGRVAGQTIDVNGDRGWVLTLSTREQHIRREKATSNICTNSGLCALAFTIHASLLGEVGLKRLAKLNHKRALQLKSELPEGWVVNDHFFNEFVVKLSKNAEGVVERLVEKGIFAGVPLSRFYKDYPNHLLIAITECATEKQVTMLADALKIEDMTE